MDEVFELFSAHEWFALSVALAPILVELIKRYLADITKWFPEWLRWLPASAIVFLVAFGEEAAKGYSWQAALLSALFLAALGTSPSIGLYHQAKRVKRAPKGGGDSAPSTKRSTMALLAALACLPLLSACGSALAWVGAVTGAIETARALLAQVIKWFGPEGTFRDVPGVPSSVYSELDAMIADATELLDRAEAAKNKGAEFQEEATALYKAARVLIVDRMLRLLSKLGWYSPESAQLVQPAGARQLRADGSAEPPVTQAVTLPPEQL